MDRGRSMLCRFALGLVAVVIIALSTVPAGAQEALIIDHKCTKFQAVPDYWIEQAKLTFFCSYGHTSHGSQIVSGMGNLSEVLGCSCGSCSDPGCTSCLTGYCDDYNFYKYGAGNPQAPVGVLSFWDYKPEGASDLGNPNYTQWEVATRAMLEDPRYVSRNFVMWSWCGQADTSAANIQIYLDLMSGLIADYPNVTFIHMTGHLVGSGEDGNLNLRNNQIRDHVRATGGVLFDFADIESYDPDWEYFLDRGATDTCAYSGGNWATEWCAAHPGDELCDSCSCAHSQPLNCNLKGRAFWWMMARLAGWEGPAQVDYDRDGDVDITDFGAFSECMAGPSSDPNPPLPPPPTAADCLDAFDTDGDLDVDLDDFNVFQAGYTA